MDFWYAQRSALALPWTGFATTTDIQRALHPPDKQDVAARLLLGAVILYMDLSTAASPMCSPRRGFNRQVFP